MRYRSLFAGATLLELAFASLPCLAGNTPSFVTGDVAQRQVSKLTGEIHWYNNLNQAEQQAQRQGKMIVWLQMLGRIDGAT